MTKKLKPTNIATFKCIQCGGSAPPSENLTSDDDGVVHFLGYSEWPYYYRDLNDNTRVEFCSCKCGTIYCEKNNLVSIIK